MSTALRVVTLRWALTFATLRKSAWQTVGYVFGLLAAISCVVSAAAIMIWLGSLPGNAVGSQQWSDGLAIIRIVLVLVTTVAGVLWMIIPLSLTGEGSSLSPRRFALYGIADSQLTIGILLSALLGTPALAALVSLLFAASAFRSLGAGIVAVAVFAAFLAVVVFVSVSKALIAVASSLVRSRRGQMFLYVAVVALMIIAFQIPGQAASSVGESGVGFGVTLSVLTAVASICAWTPWGAPFQLPVDAANGDWGLLFARLLICALTIAAAYFVSVWCLRRDRLYGQESKVTVAKGLGWLQRVPDSVSGAVSGRIAQYWQRDGRYAMGLIMPVILTAVFILRSGETPEVLWAAPLTMGMVYPMIESNNLAYDGEGFSLHALAGVSGRNDRIGRARVSIFVSLFFVIVTSLIAMVRCEAFTDATEFLISVAIIGGSIGYVLAGIGLAEVLSTVLIYPVASADKPFSSPQGRGAAQGFFPFVQMLGSLLLMLPTAGVLVTVLLAAGPELLWIVGIVGIVNGVGFLVLGIHLGGKILDRRTPAIIAILESFASLQK